mmetsp:Transcript_9971/g.22267  ORF Transcript_9971/g.22267 Transcript_9971/m.22267 type:complete len:307 (-) Transcript_9971:70-990(-)
MRTMASATPGVARRLLASRLPGLVPHGFGPCRRALASAATDSLGALAPPSRRIVRLMAPAPLREEADAAAAVVAELPSGELVEAVGDADSELDWLLVRAPMEDEVNAMSDKPLLYQDGWLHGATLEAAEHQLGDKVAARIDPEAHPVVEALKTVLRWQGKPDASPPSWFIASVAELYTGKVAGVVRKGRFLVQRPSGAVPERVTMPPELLIVPRDRARKTALAGLLGFAFAASLGTSLHAIAWLRGEPVSLGRMAWPQLVTWLSISALLLTPGTVGPCIGFANSPASTGCVAAWINLLFYSDLFSE